MIDLFQIFDLAFELFSWGWTWKLPIHGLTVYPIQLGLAMLIMQGLEEILFPLDEAEEFDDE